MKHTVHHFNMIEITLALGVVAIGILAILGLFPIGANASRDAMTETYASQTADMFLSYVSSQIKSSPANWTAYIGNASGVGGSIPSTKPSNANLDINPAVSGAGFSNDGTIHATATAGVYKLVTYRDDDGDRQLDADEMQDFSAIMAVWQEDVSVLGAGRRNIGVALKAEVSWPAAIPYAQREKDIFHLEIFNRNQ